MEVLFNNTNIVKALKKEKKDFILFDIEAGGNFPTDSLREIREKFSQSLPIFIFTHSKSTNLESTFLNYNIEHFFELPNEFTKIIEKVENILDSKENKKEKIYTNNIKSFETQKRNTLFASENSPSYSKDKYEKIIGTSPAVNKLKKFISTAATQDFPILLTGETGTGKSMTAKVIHENSNFKAGKFITVNVSCIPESIAEASLFGAEKGSFTGAENKEGIFLSANGGTLFLDELETLPLQIQAKLLDVIETKRIRPVGSSSTRKINFRLICASNKDLKRLMQENKFRQDLFYRLYVLHHRIQALRERKEDIPLLVNQYLSNKSKTISEAAMHKLLSHDWPGNIRELFNCLNRAYCLSVDENTINESHIEF